MNSCINCIHRTFCAVSSTGAVCSTFKDKENFVEVVRCKDCTQCYHNEYLGTYRCGRFMAVVDPNNYCSYGTRKNDERGTL